MSKKIIVLCILLSLVSLLYGDDKTLTVNFSPSSLSLNPQLGFTTTEAQIFTALYEGLVSYHPATLQPEPGMAESWEISEDGKSYTFHLRDNLKWSNGDPLRARDIKESWIKLLRPGKKADYASLLDAVSGARDYRTAAAPADGIGIQVPDDHTLYIQLNHRTPYFLQILCHYSFAPIHESMKDTEKWLDEESIPVNGAYQYSEKSEEGVIFLEKNPLYWDKDNVGIESLRIQFATEADELMQQFRLYEVDWIESGWNNNEIDPECLVVNPQFATSYFYFNNQVEPWNDPKVRMGLALLLPWDEIRGKEYIPSSRLVPVIPGYPELKGLEKAETDYALSFLEEAGYPAGKGLPTIKIRVSNGEAEALKIMKETWEEHLETEVIIEEIPFAAYYAALKKSDYTLGQVTWIGDFADPMTFLQMWEEGSSLNDAKFRNDDFNKLLEEAVGEDRYEKMAQAEKILLMTGQVLPLSHFPALNLIDLRFIDGWYPNVLDIHPFKHIKFKDSFVIPGSI